MAILHVDFLSQNLMRTVSAVVILPVDASVGNGHLDEPLKTLYLLHGAMGNCGDWVRETRIYRLAMEKKIAVVMPSGDNSTYLDHEDEHNYYGKFIGEELVEITRRLFPLSGKREDTYIAGLSMGGYGALRNGLKYNETFSHVASLSAGFRIEKAPFYNDDGVFFDTRTYAMYTYGRDLEGAVCSDKNPKYRAEELVKSGAVIPRLYIACGTEDERLEDTKAFVDYVKRLGVDVVCEWKPGGHEWRFWDTQIEKVLDWIE